jgi:hypothetical protein
VWLFVYFGTMVAFCFIRLARIPVLAYTKYYFHYVLANWILYYFTLFSVFVWGNIIFWANIRAPECQPRDTNFEYVYDPKILWIIVGLTLAVNWIAIFFLLQIVFFLMFLYTFWSSISKAMSKLSEDYSIKNVILCLLEALGEGEM